MRSADRLVTITETNDNRPTSVSYPNFRDWQRQASAFEGIAVTGPYEATLEGRASSERLPVTYVSSDFFSILRTRPVPGARFPARRTTGRARRRWPFFPTGSGRLTSKRIPAILGARVNLDRRPYTVIGVLAPGLRFYRPANVFVPISDAVTRQLLSMRQNHNSLDAIARLKPGVTLEQARAQMKTIASRLERAYPEANTGVGTQVVTLRDRISGQARQPVMLLLAAVSLVLLIACVNVANLLLARAADRRKEMAVRAALGASRWHVLRQLLLESTLLALAGGALGVLLSSWSFAGLARLIPASIDAGGIGIDVRVLGYTLLVSHVHGGVVRSRAGL